MRNIRIWSFVVLLRWLGMASERSRQLGSCKRKNLRLPQEALDLLWAVRSYRVGHENKKLRTSEV